MLLILTKTYARDVLLADYQMRLVRKFWSSYGEVYHLFLVDGGDRETFDRLDALCTEARAPRYQPQVRYVGDDAMLIKDGYLRQQYVKLTWDTYTALSESCLQLDADMMPSSSWRWDTRGRETPWLYTPKASWWLTGEEQVVERWRTVAERMLGTAWAKALPVRGYMAGCGWFLRRDVTQALRETVGGKETLRLAIQQLERSREPFSEYTLYGLVVALLMAHELIALEDAGPVGHPHPHIEMVATPTQIPNTETYQLSPAVCAHCEKLLA